jgi:hypothetical protein
MYIARDKKTKDILHINMAKLSENLEGIQVYSGFDPDTVEILKSELDHMPDHYNVDEKGYVVPKSREEKIIEGIIGFEELFRFQETGTASGSTTAGADTGTGIFDDIVFVLENNLIKTTEQCKIIFKYLDKHFEHEISGKYRSSFETKLLKDYIAWSNEGKPSNDKRETKYLKMKTYIDGVKEQYKPLRGELKKLITQIKAIEAAKPTESNTKAEIQRYMDAKGLFYKPDDPKKHLLEIINEQGNTAAIDEKP